MFKKLKQFWKSLGPGVITGASDNDPAGIATYSIAGAHHGYGMLWVLIFIMPIMIALQEMSARIGALSGCGLAGNIKRHYPGWLLAVIAGIIVMANTFNVGANIYGMAGAVNLLLPVDIEILAIGLSAVIVFLTIRLKYRQIVSIFKWLSMTLFAYMFALLMVNPDWLTILRHAIIPSLEFDKDFFLVLFAVIGTTISPYLYFWQASEEAEETRQDNPRIKICKFREVAPGKLARMELDTKIGMIFSNFISFFIVALTASTIFSARSGNIETLEQVAGALKPIAGEYAIILFTLGVLGAGLLSIPVLAGSAAYVIAEMFNWRGSLDRPFNKAREFYFAMTISVIVGLLIPFLGITPVQALFYTGILNGLISPFLILMIIHMSSNPAIVGPNISRRTTRALGHISFVMMSLGAAFVILVH